MAFEVSASSVCCSKCGTSYSSKRGNFYTNNSSNYLGIRRLTICKQCVNAMYESYLSVCNDARAAMRQVCRKLDVYWNDDIYDYVQKRNASEAVLSAYFTRVNTGTYIGKSYDDTLINDGTMWDFTNSDQRMARTKAAEQEAVILSGRSESDNLTIPQEVIDFWGPGYSQARYEELEHRREIWMRKFPPGYEPDAGTDALIRQICNLELCINKESAAGRQIDKYVNTLNTLLGSAMLKPAQKVGASDSSGGTNPFGVWIKKWETSRPIPQVSPDCEDVDGLKKYISTWFLGHLAKMLGIKKAELPLYEREIARLRVERPEYDDEDDEAFFDSVFSGTSGGDSDE